MCGGGGVGIHSLIHSFLHLHTVHRGTGEEEGPGRRLEKDR